MSRSLSEVKGLPSGDRQKRLGDIHTHGVWEDWWCCPMWGRGGHARGSRQEEKDR